MPGRRVAITGAGPVSAVGIGIDPFLASLRSGRSGIDEVTLFDPSGYGSTLAAEVLDFSVGEYLSSEKTYLDRSSEFALVATSLALADSGLKIPGDVDGAGVGLALGTAWGSLETMGVFFEDYLEKGPRFVKPFLFPHTYANTAASLVAIEFDLRGPHLNFASGRVSSSLAVAAACDLIRRGVVEVVVAAGCDALSEYLFAGCDLAGTLSPADGREESCAPFDKTANGSVVGEGAGALVLEAWEHAEARGGRIRAEIQGVGTASAAGGDLRSRRVAVAEAMAAAYGWERDGIDYISAAANGTPEWDAAEVAGIGEFLGEESGDCVVGSIKPIIGETGGAGGALQTIAVVGALAEGIVPPNITLSEPVDCGGLRLAGREPLDRRVCTALVNSVDPGGTVVSIAVASPDAAMVKEDAPT